MEVEEEGQMTYSAIICKEVETKLERHDECLGHNRG